MRASGDLTGMWERFERAVGTRIPRDVQVVVEVEWLGDPELQARHQGLFLSYAKRRCVEIAGQRIEARGQGPGAGDNGPTTETQRAQREARQMASKGVTLENMGVEELEAHLVEVREAIKGAKRGSKIVPRLKAIQEVLHEQLRLIEDAIYEALQGHAVDLMTVPAVRLLRTLVKSPTGATRAEPFDSAQGGPAGGGRRVITIEQKREVHRLRGEEELTHREIGERVKLPETTIAGILRRPAPEE